MTPVAAELLQLGLDDMLQMAEVASVASDHVEAAQDDQAVIRASLAAIGELLERQLAIIGDVVSEGGMLQVRAWELDRRAAVDRVRDEWLNLRRRPTLGEIGWLELTDAGRAEAKAQADTFVPRDPGVKLTWPFDLD